MNIAKYNEAILVWHDRLGDLAIREPRTVTWHQCQIDAAFWAYLILDELPDRLDPSYARGRAYVAERLLEYGATP